ncbi:putative MFS-type transporter y4rN [Phytohabitans aurantiacus]|uniref:MFS-type transporter y4rN n=2 Tax=Phytohabitans aurantiacus TaxID=3016789 RepID=A0ABQ5QS43_9ACTN|nr:putative MFS-type transporter y4rN [Phytohabitans aurantiacus]
MSMVAVAWLAVQIAPADQAAVWTGLAVAAYTLPATLGAALFGRLVRRFSGAALVAIDASLRALALGTIAVLAVSDRLAPTGYVLLLAASSLLHAWGSSGTYTLIAEVLPDGDRIAGNSLVSTFNQAAIVVGPALAGIVTTFAGPGWVIGVDAASFAFLAVSCATAVARRGAATAPASSAPSSSPSSVAGWRIVFRQPRLLGLLAVTCVFFFLYGPVEVALPIYVAHDLSGSSVLLGAFWTAFGVGAIFGGLSAGLLRDRRLSTVVIGIIIGWGAALLPMALTHAVWAGLVGLAIGGLIYGPFTAICVALFQRTSPPHALSRVLATRTAITLPSTALGTLAGGPVVTAIGAQSTLLASALLTIALGAVIALARRATPSPSPPAPAPPAPAPPAPPAAASSRRSRANARGWIAKPRAFALDQRDLP